MIDTYVHHEALMDTVVTVEVVGHGDTGTDRAERANAVARAIEWFRAVEVACSRFDPGSEVGALARRAGQSTPVSPMVFEAVSFAIALAEETDGAFDPTVGALMVARGFNREYRSGAVVGVPADAAEGVSFRDVALDATRRTITLRRALVLDLGAVAKGLAIDLAARELQPFGDFAIDAGGDLYLAGRNRAGARWAVGVRDPRHESRVLETLHVSDPRPSRSAISAPAPTTGAN